MIKGGGPEGLGVEWAQAESEAAFSGAGREWSFAFGSSFRPPHQHSSFLLPIKAACYFEAKISPSCS